MVQQDNASIKETRQTLATINEALLGFAVANGRLPRPAQSGTNGLEATVNCADDDGLHRLSSRGKPLALQGRRLGN